jgi:hypothetical protein
MHPSYIEGLTARKNYPAWSGIYKMKEKYGFLNTTLHNLEIKCSHNEEEFQSRNIDRFQKNNGALTESLLLKKYEVMDQCKRHVSFFMKVFGMDIIGCIPFLEKDGYWPDQIKSLNLKYQEKAKFIMQLHDHLTYSYQKPMDQISLSCYYLEHIRILVNIVAVTKELLSEIYLMSNVNEAESEKIEIEYI